MRLVSKVTIFPFKISKIKIEGCKLENIQLHFMFSIQLSVRLHQQLQKIYKTNETIKIAIESFLAYLHLKLIRKGNVHTFGASIAV